MSRVSSVRCATRYWRTATTICTWQISSPYLEADQRLRELYNDTEGWMRKAILNVAGSGKFSSDRTIAEYAAEIWNAKSCPVD